MVGNWGRFVVQVTLSTIFTIFLIVLMKRITRKVDIPFVSEVIQEA
jgi:hypothetical protein